MSSAVELVTELKVKSDSGSGHCPVCHEPREKHGCRTWWSMELGTNALAKKIGAWEGTLYVNCYGFPADREKLAEAMNRYHQIDGGSDG